MEKLKIGDRFKTVFTELEVIEDETDEEFAKCTVISSKWLEYAKLGDIRCGSSKWLGLRTMERIKVERKKELL